MFTWHRDPPASWVADLASISPPATNLSHAELWWEPGFPWAAVQRWIVYTLTPRHGIDKAMEVDAYLEAEYPCPCALELIESSVSSPTVYCQVCGGNRSKAWRDIYAAWTDRHLFAQPLFVLQGDRGGHRTSYTAAEAKMAATLQQPTQAPRLGSLPYAEWDNRAKHRLLAFDLAHSMRATLQGARAEHRDAMERRIRRQEQQYLALTFEALQEDTDAAIFADLPRDPTLRPVDESALTSQYIETGTV